MAIKMTTLCLLRILIHLGIEPSYIDGKILFLLVGLVKVNTYIEFLFFFFRIFFIPLISVTLLLTLKSLLIYYLLPNPSKQFCCEQKI